MSARLSARDLGVRITKDVPKFDAELRPLNYATVRQKQLGAQHQEAIHRLNTIVELATSFFGREEIIQELASLESNVFVQPAQLDVEENFFDAAFDVYLRSDDVTKSADAVARSLPNFAAGLKVILHRLTQSAIDEANLERDKIIQSRPIYNILRELLNRENLKNPGARQFAARVVSYYENVLARNSEDVSRVLFNPLHLINQDQLLRIFVLSFWKVFNSKKVTTPARTPWASIPAADKNLAANIKNEADFVDKAKAKGAAALYSLFYEYVTGFVEAALVDFLSMRLQTDLFRREVSRAVQSLGALDFSGPNPPRATFLEKAPLLLGLSVPVEFEDEDYVPRNLYPELLLLEGGFNFLDALVFRRVLLLEISHWRAVISYIANAIRQEGGLYDKDSTAFMLTENDFRDLDERQEHRSSTSLWVPMQFAFTGASTQDKLSWTISIRSDLASGAEVLHTETRTIQAPQHDDLLDFSTSIQWPALSGQFMVTITPSDETGKTVAVRQVGTKGAKKTPVFGDIIGPLVLPTFAVQVSLPCRRCQNRFISSRANSQNEAACSWFIDTKRYIKVQTLRRVRPEFFSVVYLAKEAAYVLVEKIDDIIVNRVMPIVQKINDNRDGKTLRDLADAEDAIINIKRLLGLAALKSEKLGFSIEWNARPDSAVLPLGGFYEVKHNTSAIDLINYLLSSISYDELIKLLEKMLEQRFLILAQNITIDGVSAGNVDLINKIPERLHEQFHRFLQTKERQHVDSRRRRPHPGEIYYKSATDGLRAIIESVHSKSAHQLALQFGRHSAELDDRDGDNVHLPASYTGGAGMENLPAFMYDSEGEKQWKRQLEEASTGRASAHDKAMPIGPPLGNPALGWNYNYVGAHSYSNPLPDLYEIAVFGVDTVTNVIERVTDASAFIRAHNKSRPQPFDPATAPPNLFVRISVTFTLEQYLKEIFPQFADVPAFVDYRTRHLSSHKSFFVLNASLSTGSKFQAVLIIFAVPRNRRSSLHQSPINANVSESLLRVLKSAPEGSDLKEISVQWDTPLKILDLAESLNRLLLA